MNTLLWIWYVMDEPHYIKFIQWCHKELPINFVCNGRHSIFPSFCPIFPLLLPHLPPPSAPSSPSFCPIFSLLYPPPLFLLLCRLHPEPPWQSQPFRFSLCSIHRMCRTRGSTPGMQQNTGQKQQKCCRKNGQFEHLDDHRENPKRKGNREGWYCQGLLWVALNYRPSLLNISSSSFPIMLFGDPNSPLQGNAPKFVKFRVFYSRVQEWQTGLVSTQSSGAPKYCNTNWSHIIIQIRSALR